jgi:aminoglycoside phosphotransferase (APT) family kinase protein
MHREYRIISALGPTDVPVARALAYCDDAQINGPPYYVMDYVQGSVYPDHISASAALTPEQRWIAGSDLVDVLARIHAVDPDAVGIGDLGRREGYVARQLRRWRQQFDVAKTRELPALDSVYQRLVDAVPDQGPATIVHGDYRLGNVMLDTTSHVAAVFDWELCTLGDPLADLGWLIATWDLPRSSGILNDEATVAGFPTARQAVEQYAGRTGRDVSRIGFYVTFNLWRRACILEGVYSRYVRGAMGSHDASYVQNFVDTIDRTVEGALEGANRL